MKLTKFGRRTFALIALALILIALAIGAVLVLTDTFCLPVGIGAAMKLKDYM